MCGGGDDVCVGNGGHMRAAGHETRNVRHIDHEIGAVAVRDVGEGLEIDASGIGRGAGDDKLGLVFADKIFYLVAFPVLSWQVLHQGGSECHALLMVGFTVLYMLRDTWVTFMRSVGALYGADVAAMWLGKVRTALSFPGAGWIYVYLCFHRLAPAAWEAPWRLSCYAVEGGLILLTLWSLHTYTVAYLPYLRRALERK